MKAIRIEATGGPEVMKLVEAELGKPGAGQVQVRQTAIGLGLGIEAAGLYAISHPPGLAGVVLLAAIFAT